LWPDLPLKLGVAVAAALALLFLSASEDKPGIVTFEENTLPL
jgi:hypothetical protein